MDPVTSALLVLTGASEPDEALRVVSAWKQRIASLELELALAQAGLDPETAESFRAEVTRGEWDPKTTARMVRSICRALHGSGPEFS